MGAFGVNVGQRTALPAKGGITHTDTLFLACTAVSGSTTKATLCNSVLDFENGYGERAGLNTGAWDYLDTFFKAGGKRAYVGRYGTTGGASYVDAFDLFLPKYGPGQLAVVGTTPSSGVYADMKTHCDYSDGPTMNNRVALRDVAQGTTISAMETLGDTVVDNDETGATFGPWVTVPPPPGVYGASARVIPASAIVAGGIALADTGAYGRPANPNRAPAGVDFPLNGIITGLDQDLEISDVDRVGLWSHGVNSFSDIDDVWQLYGFQTNLEESEDTPFWQFNCSRARMYLKERARARGQRYMFRNIDGEGHLSGAYKSDLEEEFKALYDVDGLFGATTSDAYYVEAGEVVNTIDEVAQGHLHAVGAAKFSLHTKAVFVDLVTVPITGSVSAA